ncbi:ATP-binding protein [Lentzea sp. HUAS12]|uniref:AAA family ATPase n=1 Tax=Lentzea sp. HUAS12 TaxID=2951806 RepID=UPI00209EE1D6|nr:ATP-binding protein [Lentzea sp. HUAS12]USX50432.1 ATP-binding protein [Lentzea sp. HUAS12]
MAWIKSVTFTGLAGNNKERTIKFNRDVNIIWGLNGCGKTSLLKILHGAMLRSTDELSRVHFRSASVEIVSGDHTFVRSIRRPTEEEVEQENLFEISEMERSRLSPAERARRTRAGRWQTEPATQDALKAQFDHRYLPVSRLSGVMPADVRYRLARAERPDRGGESEFWDELFAAALQETWRDYATQELEVIRQIQQRGLADVLTAVIGREEDGETSKTERPINAREASRAVSRFFKSQDIRLPEESIRRLVQEYAEDAVLRDVVAQIVEVQEKVDAAQEPTRKIEKLVADLFSGDKRAHFHAGRLMITLGKKPLGIMSLSSGEKQLLRLFVECRVAGTGAIIIDEPELSMHVDWQHFLIESMQSINPDAQIIVATHSPEVMARVPDEKVFQL